MPSKDLDLVLLELHCLTQAHGIIKLEMTGLGDEGPGDGGIKVAGGRLLAVLPIII